MAAVLGGFLTGFILVLCIGNYYRAKRAMERQRERRMQRLQSSSGQGPSNLPSHSKHHGGGTEQEDLLDSPGRSSYVMNSHHETDQLIARNNNNSNARQRRNMNDDEQDEGDLLLQEHSSTPPHSYGHKSGQLMSV